jgi:hypothetical protein
MIRLVALVIALATSASAQTPSLTCQDAGNLRHCWNQRGETVLTQERSPGGYTHSRDNQGHAWTSWNHNGLSTTWPTR